MKHPPKEISFFEPIKEMSDTEKVVRIVVGVVVAASLVLIGVAVYFGGVQT